MAQISISFDTATKKMAVEVDGKAVADAVSAEIYQSWDDEEKYRCNVMSRATDAGTGITTLTMLMAAESPAGRSGAPSEYPGFTKCEVPAPGDKAAEAARAEAARAEATRRAIAQFLGGPTE